MDVLSQQAVSIAVSESVHEKIAGLFATAEPPPSVNQPETAGEERRFGHAKVILVSIAHYVPASQ